MIALITSFGNKENSCVTIKPINSLVLSERLNVYYGFNFCGLQSVLKQDRLCSNIIIP